MITKGFKKTTNQSKEKQVMHKTIAHHQLTDARSPP